MTAERRPRRKASSRDNKSVFGREEFEKWADQESANPGLDADEAYLVGRFFKVDGLTLEAGTGGGRVALALLAAGFNRIEAFDFIPGYIDHARQRDPSGRINFEVMDAVDLRYAANSVDQAIYSAAMINSIEDHAQRLRAMQEAHRVLKPGGVAIFSSQAYEIRRQSQVHRLFMTYIGLLRRVRRSPVSPHALPWMRLGGRLNRSAFLDTPPYIYWYPIAELERDLKDAGFGIEGLATSGLLRQGMLHPSASDFRGQRLDGTLYAVARK
jgi:SAM-dependent methyltransferase